MLPSRVTPRGAPFQSPSSFNQSIQELVISLQKTGDPAGLSQTRMRLQTLAAVDPAPGTNLRPSARVTLSDGRVRCPEKEQGIAFDEVV